MKEILEALKPFAEQAKFVQDDKVGYLTKKDWDKLDEAYEKLSRLVDAPGYASPASQGVQNGGHLDEQFLIELKFVKCDKGKYYRTKIYDDMFLEIDMNDSFAAIVRTDFTKKREKEQITKMYLPKKMTKDKLLNLVAVLCA
jgi:hypothetical protein